MKPPQLSWRKKACFALTATVLGLALLEGLLAVAGIVPLSRTDDPFVGFDHQPLFERRDTTPPSFETRPQKLPWFNDQSFPAEKSPRTLRIFCLGGSTTYGRPYRDATSFSGQLRKLLQLALPGQSIEVINAGGVSYASYRVERLCRELMRHQPDAVIVYTGHNEFLEQRTYAPLKEMSQWRRRATGWLSHTRIFAAMHRASAAPLAPANLSSEVEAMLDGVVGLEAYQRENLHREEVLAHFRWNLRRLAQRTSDANVPLVLVAPAANLAGISPFKSQWQSDETRRSATPFVSQARSLLATGDLAGAASQWEAAIRQDQRYAELHFQLGQVRFELGELAKAEHHFRRAMEEDVCPVRATESFVQAVRDTAEQWPHAELVDFQAMLTEDCVQQCGHGCVGQEYFLDHVHPRVQWHGQLAVAIAKSLARSLAQPQNSSWPKLTATDLQRHAPAMAAWADTQLTPKVKGEGLRNLAKVLNWAGKHQQAGELAVSAAEAIPEDAEAHLLAAPYQFERGETDAAIQHARLAVKHRPDLADTHRLLGQLLAEMQDWDEASISFRHWTRLEPEDAESWRMLGGVDFQRGQWEDAIKHLGQARRLGDENRDVLFQLAAALHQMGELKQAETQYRDLRQQYPSDRDVMFNLGLLLTETKRYREAADLLRQMLSMGPDADAESLLGRIKSELK